MTWFDCDPWYTRDRIWVRHKDTRADERCGMSIEDITAATKSRKNRTSNTGEFKKPFCFRLWKCLTHCSTAIFDHRKVKKVSPSKLRAEDFLSSASMAAIVVGKSWGNPSKSVVHLFWYNQAHFALQAYGSYFSFLYDKEYAVQYTKYKIYYLFQHSIPFVQGTPLFRT